MATLKTWLDGDGVTTGEVHWSAVGAGVLVGLAGQVLLTLLGAGLGAAAYDPAYGDTASGPGFAWGAYAVWAVSGIASAFAGGWTAGWVAGSRPDVDRVEGGFQGFLAWTASTLVVTALIVGSGSAIASRVGGPLVVAQSPVVAESTTTATRTNLTVAEQQAAAEAASIAALMAFVSLLVGALAGMGGGYLGVTHSKSGGVRVGDGRTATAVPRPR